MNRNNKVVIELDSRYIIPLSEITCSNIDEFKEAPTMKVSYNGFAGELVKLEREDLSCFGMKDKAYNLSIYDSEKQVTHSFTGVKLEGVKFLGGAVPFGG